VLQVGHTGYVGPVVFIQPGILDQFPNGAVVTGEEGPCSNSSISSSRLDRPHTAPGGGPSTAARNQQPMAVWYQAWHGSWCCLCYPHGTQHLATAGGHRAGAVNSSPHQVPTGLIKTYCCCRLP
jgi:hypothetical protein